MSAWLDVVIVLLILTNLELLGSSRVQACIRIVAAQAALLGLAAVLAAIIGGAMAAAAALWKPGTRAIAYAPAIVAGAWLSMWGRR